MSHPTPVAVLRDYGPVYNLSRNQWASIRLTLRRYLAWVASGRQADPWASGAARAVRYDRPHIKYHKPSGGYDAGQCSEPEPDPALVELDQRILSLPDHDRRLIHWRIAENQTIAQCADRLGVSPDTVADRWRRLGVRVYYRLP